MEYRNALPEITAHGAGVVALAVDAPDRSEALRRSLGLPFPVLCDTSRRVVAAWSLYNRKEKGGIAFPAVYVIDPDRTIRYRSLDGTRSRVSTADVVAFLRGERGTEGPREPGRRPLRPGLSGFWLAIRNMVRYGVRAPRS